MPTNDKTVELLINAGVLQPRQTEGAGRPRRKNYQMVMSYHASEIENRPEVAASFRYVEDFFRDMEEISKNTPHKFVKRQFMMNALVTAVAKARGAMQAGKAGA